MVCHFCGCFLDENVINSICLKNSNNLKPDDKGAFTVSLISPEYVNTKRHFFGTPKIEINVNKNLDLNLNQYVNNLHDMEIKDPYYFNSNYIQNKNQKNKVIQLEVTENDILKICEKFYKLSKRLGFEIEESLLKCFKEKKKISNEMISFYVNSKYDLEEIENKKLLIFFSDFPDDNEGDFKYEEFLIFIRKFLEEKDSKVKKNKNPFENNIYNLNDTYNAFNMNYNSRSRSRSPPSKGRYNDESFKLGKILFII